MAAWAHAAIAATVLCTACAPKSSVESVVSSASIHPDLQCPPGTLGAGSGPPVGTEVWCELRSPTDAVRQGPSIRWHDNGRRQSEGSFSGGKPHGDWRYWHPNGAPKANGTYAQGLREGVWTNYHPDGSRESEGVFVGDQEHGPWVFWDPATFRRTEGVFELGKRTGRWIDVDASGVAVRERLYQEGRLVNQRELGG